MRNGIFRLVGILFILYGVYLMWYGINSYNQQKQQENWRVAMAEVEEVESYLTSTSTRHSYSVTEYNVTYRYYVNADSYTGTIRGTRVKYEVGDRFDIKYDPVDSENSTYILTPQKDVLVYNIAGGIVFALMGALPTGLWGWIRRKFFPKPEDERDRFYEKR